MKYKELERLVKKAGCYDTGRQQAGHRYGTVRQPASSFK